MQQLIEQKCPLCGSSAEYVLVDHRDKKYFNCPSCAKFVIPLQEEQYLLNNAPLEYKFQLSALSASANKSSYLRITFQTDQTSKEVFQAVILPRSTLPQ